MEEGDNKTVDEIHAIMAEVGKDVWKAKFTLYIIKPLQHLMMITYVAACLYCGTWIVALALKHSGVVHG